jgi:hypothetical protein
MLFLCAPFLLLHTMFRFFGIRINITSSLPRGFYIVSEGPAANLVEFCPEGEQPIAAVSSDRVEVTRWNQGQ